MKKVPIFATDDLKIEHRFTLKTPHAKKVLAIEAKQIKCTEWLRQILQKLKVPF